MIKKEMKLMEFVSEFKSDAYYKDNFSFKGLEVLYNSPHLTKQQLVAFSTSKTILLFSQS
jgi:hypothetical protein